MGDAGIGQRDSEISDQTDFVKDVLQRYQDIVNKTVRKRRKISPGNQDKTLIKFNVRIPMRLHVRWGRHVQIEQKLRFSYTVTAAAEMKHVSTQEFRKCWLYVSDKIPAQELFRMLKDAGIGQRDSDISDKVNFVKIVLKHYREQVQVIRLPKSICGRWSKHVK